MTIDKTIKTLTLLLNWEEVDVNLDVKVSIKLGIEALKHCQDIHHMSYEDLHILLLGETDE